MALGYQDYYKTLGIAKAASQEEIQRAYRKLARKYHPDVNKSADAEETFKRVNEAYEVLGDPAKRARYDQIGSDWQPGREAPAYTGREDIRFNFTTGDPGQFSDFFRNLFGGGWGDMRENAAQGASRRQRRGRDHEATIEITLLEAFSGGRKTIELERLEPGRDGRAHPVRTAYDVNIPAGVTDGSVIRLAGQGGKGGDSGSSGDLYLQVRIRPDHRFTINGHDLLSSINITPWEAALGAKVQIPTVDGRISMTVPAGTQSGQTFRLRGKGMPRMDGSYGDLLVSARIVVPKHLTEQERRLFEQLAGSSRFNPRT